MKHKILYYALKYEGNYDKIHDALKKDVIVKQTKYEGKYITILDTEYPECLKALNKPPYILFYKGNINLLKSKSVSIVGSRKPCPYGLVFTRYLVKSVFKKYTIVSGLARGIDACAHQSTLDFNGSTIGVLGSGINYIYPYENKDIYDDMSVNHLIISEYPEFTKPKPYFFTFRNRIVAALSDDLYVMQASLKSGTMTTVNEALELNKNIYVLPYRINEKDGEGSNRLIQEGANILSFRDFDVFNH